MGNGAIPRQPRWFWAYLSLSVITGVLHLALIEYFSGAELVRPLLIWFLLGERETTHHKGAPAKRPCAYGFPIYSVLAGFFVYRIYLIPRPEPGYQRNVPTLFYELLSSPLSALKTLLQAALQDSMYILMTYWSNVFAPEIFNLAQPANLKIILICSLAGGLLYFYLRRLRTDNRDSLKWPVSMLVIGLALVLFGPIPAWITGQSVSQDNPLWSGRLGLAAMVGASLVVVALLELLIKEYKYRLHRLRHHHCIQPELAFTDRQ